MVAAGAEEILTTPSSMAEEEVKAAVEEVKVAEEEAKVAVEEVKAAEEEEEAARDKELQPARRQIHILTTRLPCIFSSS